MKIVVMSLVSSRSKWLEIALTEYQEKIERLIDFEYVEVKSGGQSRRERQQQIAAEADALLQKIKDEDTLVLLDELGKPMSSIDFSKVLNRAMISGHKRWIFLIGGAYGVSEKIKQRAQHKIKLSELTLNHHVAKLVLSEQIYRGLAILKNLPYHNE